MISKEVISKIENINNDFENAKPFKHVVIDNFLQEDFIEKLCDDFPPFNKEKAINENGEVGPKCVHTDIASISDFYKNFDQAIREKDFLNSIEKMTGIEGLVIDRRMYGGGTHENVSGAELDVHVDFNYDTETGFHRRLNLLLYLNEDWDKSWGGAIEIISNPLDFYKDDLVSKSYNCIKNRCLIFETNEYSWHGFKRINIPEEFHHLSRKLISIYFYTKERPSEEIFANHGTFYFPYPPEVSNDDDEIKRLVKKRDDLLMTSYRKEIEQSEKINNLEQQLQSALSTLIPKYEGFVTLKNVNGFFVDNWATQNFSFEYTNSKTVNSIKIQIFNPNDNKGSFTIKNNEVENNFEVSKKEHTFEISILQKPSTDNSFKIFSNVDSSVSGDNRKLSYIIEKIIFD